MGKVQMVQLAPLVDAAFQRPARLQLQGHEAIWIASWYRGLPDQEWFPLLGVQRLKLQLRSGLFEAEAEAGAQVLATTAQRVAVAVEIALADSGEVEAIEAGFNQSVRAWRPATRFGLDLFQNQQFPLGPPNGLCEDCKTLLWECCALEQGTRRTLFRQSSAQQSHDSQADSPQVGSAHAR